MSCRPYPLRIIAWMAVSLGILLAACAHRPTPPSLPDPLQRQLAALLPADALLLGEQHDAQEHQQMQRQVVEWLAGRGTLAAVAMEMAPRGRNTRGLPPEATEAQVRAALAWNDAGWPWSHYGPVAMAAVRAGVPVLGANLPADQQRPAMQDSAWDQRLPPDALAIQQQRIRDGHCNLLPEAQILPMTRVQVARDVAMAQTLEEAMQPGRIVLLIAGNGHVERALGVPVHLPARSAVKVISARAEAAAAEAVNSARPPPGAADLIWHTPPLPPKDYCAQMREMWRATPARTGGEANKGN